VAAGAGKREADARGTRAVRAAAQAAHFHPALSLSLPPPPAAGYSF
jgi:hypothetical protein